MIEIKSRWDGSVIYTAESAQDVRSAVEEAVKRDANLRGANLRDANDPLSPLRAIRLDYWSVLDQAPAEAEGLREALTEGQVDGSCYQGECACLVGTIANVRGCNVDDLDIPQRASRPAEAWFIPIRPGELPSDKPKSEGQFRVQKAVEWLDQWVESRTAIAAAFNGSTQVHEREETS